MAVLTDSELHQIRRQIVRAMRNNIDFDKPTVNAAIQAIEDRIESSKPIISADIDAAIAPATMTAAQKTKIVGAYLVLKATKELL